MCSFASFTRSTENRQVITKRNFRNIDQQALKNYEEKKKNADRLIDFG